MAYQVHIRHVLMEVLSGLEASQVTERDIELALERVAREVCRATKKFGGARDLDEIAFTTRDTIAEILGGENDKILEYVSLTTESNMFMYLTVARLRFLNKCNKPKNVPMRKVLKFMERSVVGRNVSTRGPLQYYNQEQQQRPRTLGVRDIDQSTKDLAGKILEEAKTRFTSITSWNDTLALIVFCIGMVNTYKDTNSDQKFAVVDTAIRIGLGLIPGPFSGVALIIYNVVGRTLIMMLVSMASKAVLQIKAKCCPSV